MKKTLIVGLLAACTGCTNFSVQKSALFPGVKYDNRVFAKTIQSMDISTTTTSTNGVTTNLTVRIVGLKSDAQYLADAVVTLAAQIIAARP